MAQRSNGPTLEAPPGLDAARLSVRNEEFAVLEWPLETVPLEGGLTRAAREVLTMVVSGLSNREISRRRGTSVRTTANQVADLLRTFGAGSRYELIAKVLAATRVNGGSTPSPRR